MCFKYHTILLTLLHILPFGGWAATGPESGNIPLKHKLANPRAVWYKSAFPNRSMGGFNL